MQLCVDYYPTISSCSSDITEKATTFLKLKEHSLEPEVQNSQSCTRIKGPQTTRKKELRK